MDAVERCEHCHCGHSNAALMVAEFHRTFRCPVRDAPTIDVPEVEMRVRLIREEFQELCDALSQPFLYASKEDQIADVADALGDLLYVVHGAALTFGIPLDKCVEKIHEANMRKLWPDGQPRWRLDGKIIKPDDWCAPNLAAVLFPEGDDYGAPEQMP